MTDEMEDAFEVEDALKANRERREQIEELKKRHDVIYMQGVAALEKMKSAYTLVTKLRKEIKALEGDDYDPIWLLFNGTFNDDEEDDDGEPG